MSDHEIRHAVDHAAAAHDATLAPDETGKIDYIAHQIEGFAAMAQALPSDHYMTPILTEATVIFRNLKRRIDENESAGATTISDLGDVEVRVDALEADKGS